MLTNKSALYFSLSLLFSAFYYATAATDDRGFADVGDDSLCADSDPEEAPDWVKNGGFLILFVIVIQMFWALALVCEEFFVPALNVMCEEFKIPDDVAGATFMAAGASSPELFTAMIGLLVYDSNIGVGTVVGSEIFNHMIISSGSVLFAKGGVLNLDARILLRDLIAYAFSLLVLIWALKDSVYKSLPHAFESSSWDECLHVTLGHSIVLIVVYIIYAIVAGNYQGLILKCCPRTEVEDETEEDDKTDSKTDTNANADANADADVVTDDAMKERPSAILTAPFPRASFRTGSLHRWDQNENPSTAELQNPRESAFKRTSQLAAELTQKPTQEMIQRQSNIDRTTNGIELASVASPLAAADKSTERTNTGADADAESTMANTPAIDNNLTTKKTAIPGAPEGQYLQWLDVLGMAPRTDIGDVSTSSNVLKLFLSTYVDQIQLDALPPYYAWSTRYFTIDHYGLHSISDPEDHHTGTHVEIISLLHAEQVIVTDKNTYNFMVLFNDESPAVQLKAFSPEALAIVVDRLSTRIKQFQALPPIEREIIVSDAQTTLWEEVAHEHSLLTWPRGRLATVWHVVCLPLRFLFEYTLQDVRVSDENRAKYGSIICICIGYLALLSYIMILCCDYIGSWLGTTPTVMGLTLSAVGTSFPNLWSSMIVARQGYGSMAIGNALGSNIFNVNIALGLPWLVLVLSKGGASYNEMRDHGIVMFVVLLEFVCVIWFAMIALNGFKIYAWMSFVFIAIYLIVLITAVSMS